MALLVVDMQYFDAHPDWGEGHTAIEMGVADAFAPYFAQIDAIIPHIQQLLTAFREKELEVIHIRVAEWTDDSRDVGWKQLARGLVVPKQSKEAELLTEVASIGDELVISKSSSGVFATTNLDRLLRNMGIKTLIFTGTATGGCIESAVRDAVDLGYEVVLVTDASADSTPASQEVALRRMSGLVHLLTTAALAEKLLTVGKGSHQQRSGLERVKTFLPQPPTTPPGPEVNPYSLIFPPAIQLALATDNCALVLIDTQRFACDPTCAMGNRLLPTVDESERTAYYGRVKAALSKMTILLATCRQRNMTIIYVRTAAQLTDGRDLSHYLRAQGVCPVQGTSAADFIPAIAPQTGVEQISEGTTELVLNKPGLGIFTGTGIDERLRNLGIEQLILTGISFAGGLEGSIRSASDRGYGVVIVPDACATVTEAQQNALSGMESGIINVRNTAAINVQLQALTR